jgi:hypothetical protein
VTLAPAPSEVVPSNDLHHQAEAWIACQRDAFRHVKLQLDNFGPVATRSFDRRMWLRPLAASA